MRHPANTRTSHQPDHLVQTPDSFVHAPLPGMQHATAVVHVAPARGAGFMQYTVEFEINGNIPPTLAQRFVYVLDGEVTVGNFRLTPGHFAYIPAAANTRVSAARRARATVIEKHYIPLAPYKPPALFAGQESSVAPQPLAGDAGLEVRTLIPSDFAFDFAVNTMTFQPGASLPIVETHVMEHGLLMLEGSGIYRLNDCWYPVNAGDFIWMAPYCPQWFGALGKTPTKYLIYKDWNRSPLP